MLEKFKKLPLRKGVGIVLLNQNNEVFVAKRIDNPNNYWQMPQGGIDENEDYLCLLYTSPSPRDMRRSRMPSSA